MSTPIKNDYGQESNSALNTSVKDHKKKNALFHDVNYYLSMGDSIGFPGMIDTNLHSTFSITQLKILIHQMRDGSLQSQKSKVNDTTNAPAQQDRRSESKPPEPFNGKLALFGDYATSLAVYINRNTFTDDEKIEVLKDTLTGSRLIYLVRLINN
jgi:hypothetical protein